MQGSGGTTGSLQEALYYDLVTSSSDASIDQQGFWNDSTNPVGWVSDFSLSPNDTDILHLNSSDRGGDDLNPWSIGEPSSNNSQNEVGCVEPKAEHDWLPSPKFEYGPQNVLSMDDVNLNFNSNGMENAQLLPLASHSNSLVSHSDSLAENLDIDVPIHASSEDDCQIIEDINDLNTGTSLNTGTLSSGSSSIPGGLHSRDGNSSVQLSQKRKAIEIAGQSSIDGASSFQQTAWDGSSAQTSAASSSRNTRWRSGTSYPEFTNQYLNLPDNIYTLRGSIQTKETGNPLLPDNTSTLLGSIQTKEMGNPSDNFSALLGSNQTRYVGDDANSPNQSFVVRIPPLPQSGLAFRRNGASTSAPGSSSTHVISEFRDAEDPNIRNITRRNIERSLFIPTADLTNLTPNSRDWNPPGGNISIPGNVAPSFANGFHSDVNLSSSSNQVHHHRNSSSPHQRQLAEMIRRQLLSTGSESGGQSQRSFHSGISTPTQEMNAPSLVGGSSVLGPSPLNEIRGFSNSLRNLPLSSDGRSRLLSEIHSALESARSESFRFHERFFNSFSEAHDRHRDMRLDVDSMSYEELLALEERMGYVNTGLSEEVILKKLKIYKYSDAFSLEEGMNIEPCCICREDYSEGEEMRALECVHEFHADCIKKWLVVKNQCPICKKAALKKL